MREGGREGGRKGGKNNSMLYRYRVKQLLTLRLEMCLKTNGFDMAICLRMLSFIAPMYVWYTAHTHTHAHTHTRTHTHTDIHTPMSLLSHTCHAFLSEGGGVVDRDVMKLWM